MARTSFAIPPDFRTDPEEFREWQLEVANALFGLGEDTTGGLTSNDNIPSEVVSGNANVVALEASEHAQGTDQSLDAGGANSVSVVDVNDAVTKKHDPGSSHNVIIQASALVNHGAIATTETADGTYSSNEQDMLNNIKTDLGTIVTLINTLLANLRTSKAQAS